jgi:hypothetical protein
LRPPVNLDLSACKRQNRHGGDQNPGKSIYYKLLLLFTILLQQKAVFQRKRDAPETGASRAAWASAESAMPRSAATAPPASATAQTAATIVLVTK